MSVRSVPVTLLGVGALWWVFFFVSDIVLFADIGAVCVGVALVLAVPAFVFDRESRFGFAEGVVGAYGGAVTLVGYRLLADPPSDLAARPVAAGIPLLERPTGLVVPETALGLAVAAAFAVGLARDQREHAAALFVAGPPVAVSLVAVARSEALDAMAAITVLLTVSGAAAVLFYAGRYLRAGGETGAVSFGLE